MQLEPLDLSIRARHPDYYDKSRDMETALTWNAIQKILTESGREELFKYIKSVRLTEKYIVITTEKPVANKEIRFYREKILAKTNEGLKNIGSTARERISFR